MNAARIAKPQIAEMEDRPALPRRSGELVFHDEWERRAFAIAVSLAEQGRFEWSDFQRRLIEAVAVAEGSDPLHPSRGYYESWLAALEAVLDEKQLLEKRSA
jgi:nitrile hydratase accessory protein